MNNELIEELKAELQKADGGSLKPARRVDDIEKARRFGFPDVLLEFYRENSPDVAVACVQLKQRIWSIENAIIENSDYVPGTNIFPLDNVVFASSVFGDAYCVDTIHTDLSGECPIVLFPHDVIDEGASIKDVEQYRLVVAPNLEDFLRQFAQRTLREEPKYE